MKNLIEVLFEFKDKGSDVIDQNRQKLSEMAISMEEAAKQAGYLVKTQKEIDKALNEGSSVIEKKTKAQREADKIERAAAKEREAAKKAELKAEKEIADQEAALAKEKSAEIKEQAKLENEAAKIAKQQAKEKADAAKAAAALEKQAKKEQQEIIKQQKADEKARLAQIKQAAIEEKRIQKEKDDQIKAGQKQTKAALAAEAAAEKERLAKQKEIAAQWKAVQKQQTEAQKAADLKERQALVESLRLKNQQAKADKEAMLAANRAAREAERSAAAQVKAQEKVTIAAQKAADAQAKAAAKAAAKNDSTSTPSGGTSGLDEANSKMEGSIKNLKLIKVAVAGVAAAAIVAVAAFARSSADEFYKMKLSAETAGLDVRVLQEYKDVLDSVGISTDEFAQKMRQLNEKFVEGFTEASGDGMEVIKTLNLDMKEFADAAPEKKFEMIVKATKDLSKVQRLQIFDKLGLDNLNLVANRMDLINKKKEEIKKTGLLVTDEEAGRLRDFENSFNNFNNKMKTFSTIIYSAMIPALQDTFGEMFDGFNFTRDGANSVIDVLVSVIQVLGKVGAFGKLILDSVINQFKIWGTYTVAVADGLGHLYNKMSISIGGIVDILKNINIGEAIADLSKKTFAGILDVVFDSMDMLVSGIEKLASSISGVLPDAVLSQIKSSRQAISKFRTNLYTYEQSEESKKNDEIIAGVDARTKAEQDIEDAAWKKKQAKNRRNLDEVKAERDEDVLDFAKSIVRIDGVTGSKYTKTIEEATAENAKEDEELIKMLDATEERTKQIDQLMANAETIRQKIDLGIKKADGSAYIPEDFLKLYDEAIAIAGSDAKLLNKEIELRIKKRDDEIAFFNDQYSKKMEVVKASLDNLKTLDEITEKPFGNKDEVLKKYDSLIALAKEYKKTESEVNQLVLERKQYLDSYNEAQKKYISDINNLETQLLEAQDKGQEARAKKRKEALLQIEKDYANATDAQKAKAIELTDNLFNINNAKARIAELNTEIDKLIDARQNKTDVFDRTKLLELETQINEKLNERNGLEDQLGQKRKANDKDFVLSLQVVQGILENTYTNLATLVSSTVTGVETLGDATRKFFESTLNYIAQLFQKILVMKAMNLLTSSFGFGVPSGGTQAPIYHEGGIARHGIDGNGVFPAMGRMSSKEMTATLNSREAILTETQQENLGNALASGQGSSGNVTAVIHNNIDLPSLARGITETAEFRQGTMKTITKDRSTYKQVLS